MSRSSPHNDVPPTGASAFNNGRNQNFTSSNILNSQGNITFINWNPQLPSVLFDNFLKAFSDFVKPVDSNGNDEEQNFNDATNTLPVDVDGGGGDIASGSSKEDDINMIPSHETTFLPDTLARAPASRRNYVESLFPLGYGYPLWSPQLDRNLPLEYQRSGISVGDVGFIGPNGAFHFLFNIWLPADHPFHSNLLPKSFDKIEKPARTTTFQPSFNPGYSTVSNLCVSSRLESSSGDIIITCKDGDKGAIVAIPDGASEEDVKNERDLVEFISQRAFKWFQYIRWKLGIIPDRHSLYVITGCMKAKTWGIGSFEKSVQERNSVLVLGKTPKSGISGADGTSYIWKQSGEATTFRTGPSLYADPDPKDDLPQGDNENQCLFIRGFKIGLSSRLWSMATKIPSMKSPGRRRGPKNLKPGSRQRSCKKREFPDDYPTPPSMRYKGAHQDMHPATVDHTSISNSNMPGQSGRSTDPVVSQKATASSSSASFIRVATPLLNQGRPLLTVAAAVHPSDALSDLMLSQVVDGLDAIAIIHDKIWDDLVGFIQFALERS